MVGKSVEVRAYALAAMKSCSGDVSKAAKLFRKQHPDCHISNLPKFLKRWGNAPAGRVGDLHDAPGRGRRKLITDVLALLCVGWLLQMHWSHGEQRHYEDIFEVCAWPDMAMAPLPPHHMCLRCPNQAAPFCLLL